MDLVKPKDILKASPALGYLGGEYFAKFLMYVLRFNKLNKLYAQMAEKQGLEFIDEVLRILEFNVEFDENELKRIPKEGPAVVVANHPFGGLDGMLLIKLISTVRSDVRVLANNLLKKIEPLSDFYLAVTPEPTGGGEEVDPDFPGAGEVSSFLQNGGLLCVFPAGEPSSYDLYNNMTDRLWRYPLVKFIKLSEAPVVPVLFQGTNSRLLHLVSKIHPSLKSARLPSELFSKRHKTIKIRIGNAIRPAEQERFCDIYQFGRYLRARVYGMESPIEVKRFFNYSLMPQPKPETIIDPVPKELILKEVQKIKHDYILFKLKEYTIFCVPTREIPNILTEIGRLREITFREVGEGTNQSIDIDEFDLYYNQMFIWDEAEEQIVGAYRLGLGREILGQYGKRGFYFHTLFRADDQFAEILGQSLELGRSFVVKEYQRKPMPLFLLWKGILIFLLKNPEYRYMIGPVSISNNYSPISKDLIIKFIMANHFDWRLGQQIKPRNSYKFRSNNPDINILMENMDHDINKLDKTIGDVDALNSGLPVLLKKYIKLNAKIIGFNVDPKFNNCLDGLIVLDIFDVPKNTIESLSKEVNDGSILERFYSNRE